MAVFGDNDWNKNQSRSRMDLEDEDQYYTKKKTRLAAIIAAGALVLLAIILLVVFYPRKNEAGDLNARIAATIFPIYDITRNIVGNAEEVTLILPPGASPHTFESTPSLAKKMQKVEVVFAVGHGLDDWSLEFLERDIDRVVVDKGLAIMASDSEYGDKDDLSKNSGRYLTAADEAKSIAEEAGEGIIERETDPHYWLTLINGQMIAKTIAKDLSSRFPEHEKTFQRNLRKYLKELSVAEGNIKDGFDEIQARDLITVHDSWFYFVVHYGFNIAGTFESASGQEPTPQHLAELSAVVDSFEIKVIYGEAQASTDKIAQFAKDLGLNIVKLDSIGGVDGRDTYKKLIEYNARIIKDNQED